ncbi:MAG: hypothetical protein EXR60_01375 [Dehalococcoidia bacterium]|nr:hypothetical protein [Dehalococcoidia bacterium]
MTPRARSTPPSKDYRCRRCGHLFPVFCDAAGNPLCPVCGKHKPLCCLRCEAPDVEEAVPDERYLLGQPGAAGLTEEDYYEAVLKP